MPLEEIIGLLLICSGFFIGVPVGILLVGWQRDQGEKLRNWISVWLGLQDTE